LPGKNKGPQDGDITDGVYKTGRTSVGRYRRGSAYEESDIIIIIIVIMKSNKLFGVA
jgi:hypothetical protein